MRCATACGSDTYTAWLPSISTTLAPVRLDMARCASGGIILSLVATRYQLGFDLHADERGRKAMLGGNTGFRMKP